MKNKDFTVLILVLVVLVIILFLFANPFKVPQGSKSESAMLFPDLVKKDPAEIIVNGTNDLHLWKKNDEWLVKGEREGEWLPADTAGVNRALRAIHAATDRELVSQNPEKQAIFEVDSTGTYIEILDADSSALVQLRIGKSATTYSTNYVRPEGSNNVYVVGQRIKNQFDRAWRGLRDMYIVQVPREEVRRIEVTRHDSLFSYELQDDTTWLLTSPKEGKVTTPYSSRLLNTVSNFRGAEIVTADTLDTGFDTPFLKIVMIQTDGSDRAVLIGNESETEGRRYAKLDGEQWVYEIGKPRLETLMKPLDEILEPPPEPTLVDSARVDTLAAGATPIPLGEVETD
jgi:hypothetical protein